MTVAPFLVPAPRDVALTDGEVTIAHDKLIVINDQTEDGRTVPIKMVRPGWKNCGPITNRR